MRDFITECPKPWLHYNYCTPCLELARHSSTGTVITEHIAQCEALYGQCWDGQHEEHTWSFRDILVDANVRIMGASLIRYEPYTAPYNYKVAVNIVRLENGC